MDITSHYIKKLITDKAKELGFFKIGFARYEILEDQSQKLKRWLDLGYDADMEWIKRGFEKRRDIRLIMPEAKSVISLAYNYYTPFEHYDTKPKISRYAWGKDYHKILKPKLKELCGFIEKTTPNPLLGKEGTLNRLPLSKGEYPPQAEEGVLTRSYVDDGPVMDKAWAEKAGIGWMGKHTNIINPEYGSWFFICNIITNIEFDTYSEPIEDLCGSCSLCISACPTGAITSEYVVDANKCISYQTIENRGEIPESINLSGWIFGCDVCQDVCPYNSPKYNHVTSDESFYPNPVVLNGVEGQFAGKNELESITEDEFNEVFASSPIKRTKFKGWKRNIERFRI
jgi:epoxyqueuosine reductase